MKIDGRATGGTEYISVDCVGKDDLKYLEYYSVGMHVTSHRIQPGDESWVSE